MSKAEVAKFKKLYAQWVKSDGADSAEFFNFLRAYQKPIVSALELAAR